MILRKCLQIKPTARKCSKYYFIKSLDVPGMWLYSVARMFVQTTKCTHGKSTYLTYLVRESFRTAKGPRSRTICNITALPPSTRELIAQSLRGQSFVATEAWR